MCHHCLSVPSLPPEDELSTFLPCFPNPHLANCKKLFVVLSCPAFQAKVLLSLYCYTGFFALLPSPAGIHTCGFCSWDGFSALL